MSAAGPRNVRSLHWFTAAGLSSAPAPSPRLRPNPCACEAPTRAGRGTACPRASAAAAPGPSRCCSHHLRSCGGQRAEGQRGRRMRLGIVWHRSMAGPRNHYKGGGRPLPNQGRAAAELPAAQLDRHTTSQPAASARPPLTTAHSMTGGSCSMKLSVLWHRAPAARLPPRAEGGGVAITSIT